MSQKHQENKILKNQAEKGGCGEQEENSNIHACFKNEFSIK